MAQVVARGLREHSYAVDIAGDGNAALYQTSINDYDLILLDVLLPGLDGFDVLREVRRRMPGLPVLVLTARKATDDVHKAIGLGAHSYMVKPFDDKQFLDRVARMTTPRGLVTKTGPAAENAWEV